MPTISLNGESRTLPTDCSVEDLIRTLESEARESGRRGLDRRALAVEVNRAIVPRSTYAEHPLAEGDEIEIVTIVGGG